jgi:hypothetical protein
METVRIDRTHRTQLTSGMNTKRFFFAFLAAFIFIFCWGWLYNGVLMRGAHTEVRNLFRPLPETMSLFHWLVIGQAIIALAFVLIYAVQPFTAKLIMLWSLGGLIEMIVTGAIVGAIYGGISRAQT